MSVIVNNWTSGKPNVSPGATGIQSIKHIPACRVFVKAAESITAAPVYTYAAYSFKTNGIAPTGWTDLGTTQATGKITYTKNLKKVQTGLDKVTRSVYIGEKDANIEVDLTQLDDLLLTNLGFNGSAVTAGSTFNFQFGQEDVVQKALLLVYANKIDGKEIHWYHPAAYISVSLKENSDELDVTLQAECTAFTAIGATNDSLMSVTVFA